MRPWTTIAALAVVCVGCGQGSAATWSPRVGAAAAVLDDHVYVAGGIEHKNGRDATVAMLDSYSMSSGTWTRRASMRTPRSYAAAATLAGRVYVFGGVDPFGTPLNSVEVYDPKSNSWTFAPPMNRALRQPAVTSHSGRGILVGGGLDVNGTESSEVRYFIPSEGVWKEWLGLNSPRSGLGLVAARDETDRVFAVGGESGGAPVSKVDVFGHDQKEYRWRPGPDLKATRGTCTSAVVGRRVLVLGANVQGEPTAESLDMDNVESGWVSVVPLPTKRVGYTIAAWQGRMYVFGGSEPGGRMASAGVLEYNVESNTWRER